MMKRRTRINQKENYTFDTKHLTNKLPFSFGLVSPLMDAEVNKTEFSQILEWFFR